jgi:hypothetical protein
MKKQICHLVRRRLIDLEDGTLSPPVRTEIAAHLESCAACQRYAAGNRQVRQVLGGLAGRAASPALSNVLLVLASREALRKRKTSSWAARMASFVDDLALDFNNLIRPMALPMAGGSMASAAVFLMLLGMVSPFQVHASSGHDVPTVLFTEAKFKGMVGVDFRSADIIVDLVIDEQGRVVDYEIAGGILAQDASIRRSIEHILLYTEFEPALAFGQPVRGRVRLSFRADPIDVRG